MYRVKVGESLFAEASAPSKKAARQLAAEEAVKELMADGRLQLNKVRSGKQRVTRAGHLGGTRGALHIPKMSVMTLEEQQITQSGKMIYAVVCLSVRLLNAVHISLFLHSYPLFSSPASVAPGLLQ